MRRLAAVAVLAVAIAGCGGGGGDSDPPLKTKLTDKQVISGWLAALNAGDYVSAGSFFARGAIVQQSEVFRLRNRTAAERFNSRLPCKGNLGTVRDEGKTTLATFHLRRGPGGNCHGAVQVRFTIRHGKFTEWRQLPEPSGPVV
jgi:hypothetical protein